MVDSLMILLQLSDSGFPAGAFAHSGGLESLVQSGQVEDVEQLPEILLSLVRQQARLCLPFAMESWRSPEAFETMDSSLDVMLSNHIANAASRRQGQAMLASSLRIFEQAQWPANVRQARRLALPCHLAVVFGAVARILEIDQPSTAAAFVLAATRTLCSAAVRLGMIGPIEAQQLQLRIGQQCRALIEAAPALTLDDAVQISPISEIAQACHDRLYSRLFVS